MGLRDVPNRGIEQTRIRPANQIATEADRVTVGANRVIQRPLRAPFVTGGDVFGEAQRQEAHAAHDLTRVADLERELRELWPRHAELERVA